MVDLQAAGIVAAHLVIRLDDYLWFASHEWGNDNETAPILHGYALSFALSGRERVLAVGGVPFYEEDLANVEVYCTPARLLPGSGDRAQRAAFTFNAVEDPTQGTQALALGDKVNDPKMGRRQVLVPGLRFELVAFVRKEFEVPRVFRLGKKRSPVVVERQEAIKGKASFMEGGADGICPSHAVNPLDVAGDVIRCVPRSIPPHMIFERAWIKKDLFLPYGRELVHVPKTVRAWA